MSQRRQLQDWLVYIEQLHPKCIDMGLDRIRRVADKLGVDQLANLVITIAGTNGKGSCVKFLETAFTLKGYQVGAYTSPHLLRFNERIRINNQEVADSQLCQAFQVIEKARDQVHLTFFEFTTLAALWIFKQRKLEVVLLEVGLGGRLDAVNLVAADIAIITSIALDHTDWLGVTREAIAIEKAGIFRRGKIVICGDPNPPAPLVNHAKQLATSFYCRGKDFDAIVEAPQWTWTSQLATHSHLPMPSLPLQNVATAIMAIELAKPFLIDQDVIINAIKSASLQGRFQRITAPYPCLLDVAHNPAAGQLLADNIANYTANKFVAVVGMLADKDIENTLKPLDGQVREWHLASLNVARGANSIQLKRHLRAFTAAKCYTYDCVSQAFNAATRACTQNENILVFGSFYTVAEALKIVQDISSNTPTLHEDNCV